jgi:hypothetical protein
MYRQEIKSYRSYALRCRQEQLAPPDEPPIWHFVVEEVAKEGHQREFRSLQEVMEFLVDELLGVQQEVQWVKDG